MGKVRTLFRAVRDAGGENAPAVFFFALYIGLCVLACLSRACRIAASLVSGSIIGILLWNRRRGAWRRERFLAFLICVACAASGVFSLLYHDLYRASYRKMIGETRTGYGVVTEVYGVEVYGGTYLVRFRDDARRLPYTVVLTTASAQSYTRGQRIRGSITIQDWSADDTFDAERYYGADGAVLPCESADCVADGMAYTPMLLLKKWNAVLSARLSAHVRDGGLAAAVFLGDRSALSDTTKLWFRRAGIYHLLAVSGTHLGILVQLTEYVLVRKWHGKPKKRRIFLILLCAAYMALTGFPASIKRAGIMYIAAQLFRLRDSDLRGTYALSLSAVAVVLLSPCAVWDIGLQLSVCAVAGCHTFLALLSHRKKLYRILAGKRAATKRGKRLRRLRFAVTSSVMMTAIVTAILLPLSFFYFGEVSLAGFCMNLLYIPAITVELCLVIVYLALSPLPILILPLAAVLEGYTKLLLLPAAWVAGIRGVCLSLRYPGLWVWLIVVMVMTVCLPYPKRRRLYLTGYAVLLALMCCHIAVCRAVSARENVVVYESSGKRDGFVVQSAGRVYLIDVSDGAYTFTKRLTETARDRYAVEIEGYFLTHYHKRHLASFQKLCGSYIVYGLYLPEPQTDAEWSVYQSLTTEAQKRGVPVTVGETALLGEIAVQTAPRTYLKRSSHPITAVRFTKDGNGVAYASSSWNEGEACIADWLAAADVLFFGAHSPVYKKPFAVAREREPILVVWNGDAARFGEEIPAEYTAYGRERTMVRMK